MPTSRPSLLIAGGHNDPNLAALAQACKRANINILDARHANDNKQTHTAWTWTATEEPPTLNGSPINPAPDGAFIRYDAFGDGSHAAIQRAAAWHEAVMGWLNLEHNVRLFNRSIIPQQGWKPAMLKLAKLAGLETPKTVITNEQSVITTLHEKQHQKKHQQQQHIAKPVAGGDYCRTLDDSLASATWNAQGLAASPAIIQNQLVQPEIRVFFVGRTTFTFSVASPSLDYRVKQDANVTPISNNLDVTAPLLKLASAARMDFGAADFKTNPQTGRLEFLELNTSPMFARFDAECNGRLTDAIAHYLTSSKEPHQESQHASNGTKPKAKKHDREPSKPAKKSKKH